ncbi:MAG TPA: zf-HC2 domain-containing protein [Tepidisphaeraceae bacterium]|nr:zf-HC2 domain-containing protein [Tepidisphaeraceae bacterium]
MSQNQEIIEAKLCAYIDGELDAEGRVEIERHLEANPQHRRLLESLRATRDLIKWLPREAAPSEVAETLNGQLERSVLLDDATETLGPSIWPRVLAAAAIVLLTAGLFAAVYFTLPKSQKIAIPYAREGAAPSAEPSAGEPGRSPAVAENTESGPIALKGGMAGKTAAADQKDSVDIKKPELDRLALEVNQNRAAIVAAANKLNAAPGAAGGNAAPALATNAVVVLVRSNSPSDTRKQLTSYLDAQKIDWKQTEPEGQLNASPQSQQQAVQQQSIAAEQSNERESGRPATTQRGQSDVATLAPSPQVLRQQENLARSVTTQSSGYAINGWNVTTVDSAGGMYVARMSRQQAVQLSNSISQEGSQTVELKDLENASQPALPATVPSQLDAAVSRDASGPIQPTTRPTEQALGKEAPPATQPAQAEAAPDQALDVVIVVQSSAPTTQPATQPTGAAPATSDAPQTQPVQSGKP